MQKKSISRAMKIENFLSDTKFFYMREKSLPETTEQYTQRVYWISGALFQKEKVCQQQQQNSEPYKTWTQK